MKQRKKIESLVNELPIHEIVKPLLSKLIMAELFNTFRTYEEVEIDLDLLQPE